jgi:hypothetical protein
LQEGLRRFRRDKNIAEILLQHDKALPHTSLETQKELKKLGWTVLPYPPHSPDLAALDFHLFVSLRGAICGETFGSLDEVTEEAKKWLRVQNPDWYTKGINAVFAHWHKMVEIGGDFVEE